MKPGSIEQRERLRRKAELAREIARMFEEKARDQE